MLNIDIDGGAGQKRTKSKKDEDDDDEYEHMTYAPTPMTTDIQIVQELFKTVQLLI